MNAATSIPRTHQHGGADPWADPGWSGAMAFMGPVHLHDEPRPDHAPRADGGVRALIARLLGTASTARPR
ncbi:hypothetical protein [Agromyces binzhouensis]|uniref:Uncharacterized protein n=1 Tax=Agromyces binzhouensis TaxID=1817495 RepID=A0A4Q2J8F4_9MICO|nr:hypothetical protein [Agromyces binzhouensis]RXZ41097.1 hypothetical protein ESO86_16665 [Agromyces binzhouensis]